MFPPEGIAFAKTQRQEGANMVHWRACPLFAGAGVECGYRNSCER